MVQTENNVLHSDSVVTQGSNIPWTGSSTAWLLIIEGTTLKN